MRNNWSEKENETIELTLPVNAAYVSAARLTASSVSNRIGYNIEEIEDIKAAVSEACIFMMKQCQLAGQHHFKIQFIIENSCLCIKLSTTESLKPYDKNELGIRMIQALMDELIITENSDKTCIMMKKIKKTY